MPCASVVLALISPRLLIAVLFFFTDYLARGYGSWEWPTLGFFFMPWTTLAYAFAINANGAVSDIYLAIVVVAALTDLGSSGGGARLGGRRRRR